MSQSQNPVSNQRTRYFDIGVALRSSSAPEARLTVELISILVEDARSRLVKASGEDMLRIQGEARAFEKLYRELTTAPVNQET